MMHPTRRLAEERERSVWKPSQSLSEQGGAVKGNVSKPSPRKRCTASSTGWTSQVADLLDRRLASPTNESSFPVDAAVLDYLSTQLRRADIVELPDVRSLHEPEHLSLVLSPQERRALYMPRAVTAFTYTQSPAPRAQGDRFRCVTLVIDTEQVEDVGPFGFLVQSAKEAPVHDGLLIVGFRALIRPSSGALKLSQLLGTQPELWTMDCSFALVPRQDVGLTTLRQLSVAGSRVFIGILQPMTLSEDTKRNPTLQLESWIDVPVHMSLLACTGRIPCAPTFAATA